MPTLRIGSSDKGWWKYILESPNQSHMEVIWDSFLGCHWVWVRWGNLILKCWLHCQVHSRIFYTWRDLYCMGVLGLWLLVHWIFRTSKVTLRELGGMDKQKPIGVSGSIFNTEWLGGWLVCELRVVYLLATFMLRQTPGAGITGHYLVLYLAHVHRELLTAVQGERYCSWAQCGNGTLASRGQVA